MSAKNESITLADLKKVWISRKFSFIYEARPTTNAAWFMQPLYAHSIGYLVSSASLSQRLGGLYCLYCLQETQPYKPPFRIYLSLGELRGLKNLVIDSKKENVKVASPLVNRMLVGNMFLFGAVDLNESSATEKLKEKENASIRIAQKNYLQTAGLSILSTWTGVWNLMFIISKKCQQTMKRPRN